MVFIIILVSFLSVASYALNTCNIDGVYKGKFIARTDTCVWDARSEVCTNNGMVRMVTDLHLVKGTDCTKDTTFVMMGTCESGMLKFDLGYNGYSCGDVITLTKKDYQAILRKDK